jgi:hypothetical protein
VVDTGAQSLRTLVVRLEGLLLQRLAPNEEHQAC